MNVTPISIQNDLGSNERIEWTGKPRQGVFLKASDALQIPFSLLWAGFSFFWEYSVFQSYQAGKAPIFMVLWGVPFVAVGLHMLIFRFFYDSFVRSNTVYAITNYRVLIKSAGWQERLISLQRKSLPALDIAKSREGLTTITFGANPSLFATGRRARPPAFEQIIDGAQALDLLNRSQS